MKQLSLASLLILTLVTLTGCVTKIHGNDGKTLFSTSANAQSLHYQNTKQGITVDVEKLDHSTVITAAGGAFAKGANAAGSAASGALVSIGSSGILKPIGAVLPAAASAIPAK